MPLTYEFVVEPDSEGALVLPYPRDDRDGRTNAGFVDLRGRPALASAVAEAQPSSALRDLLVGVSAPDSYLMSIGCDLGASQDPTGRYHAGGYLQFALSDLRGAALDRRNTVAISDMLRGGLVELCEGRDWHIEFALSVVGAAAIGGPEQVWSAVIHFDAEDDTLNGACTSCDMLIVAMHQVLAGSAPSQ